ncbi:hypothetical protein [Streptomyces microflavus]|uniref:hypothetical protein n=1 Tax=Streptomyces microflavus TaxID=1919 RepID=UPI002E35BC72|nr:hypothetical protein [Streptomyces microflavus]
MTTAHEADPELAADAPPATVLPLASQTTRFRDHLAALQFGEPSAPARAQDLAERAAALRQSAESVAAELGTVRLYRSPPLGDTFSRLRLLATQAQLADET